MQSEIVWLDRIKVQLIQQYQKAYNGGGISYDIGAILFYTPFPLSIPLAIAAFILLNFHFRKKVIKRMNPMSGSSSYSCINCGTRHNEIACPKCGSMQIELQIFFSFLFPQLRVRPKLIPHTTTSG
jgi:hypothetical protein